MKYVHLVFTKAEDEKVTIAGAFTSQQKAWNCRSELRDRGLTVISERVPLNEESNVLLNVWYGGNAIKTD